ncbi:MAG: hypothetical protein ACRDT6_24045, partial [Micromonosporaceae bacterium]
MAQQLHYASVASGASGRAGFQFTARSDGAHPELERAIERFMTYRPPSGAHAAECPVSLAYEVTPYGAIAVCCRYLGEDYTGRPGNFLGHAVVAAPEELDGIRPIELWRSPLWAAAPAAAPASTLPPVAPVPTGEVVDPERVGLLLRTTDGYALLAAILDATRDALAGQSGPVALVSDDVDTVALWIAAVTYSLPFAVARCLSFVTYTADPHLSRHHLVGTTPRAWAASRSDRLAFGLPPLPASLPARATSPYATAAATAWRTGELAEIDTLCAIAAVAARPAGPHAAAGGGPLDAAASLLALCRGEPADERYQGAALRLLQALPDHDRARLLDRTAASLADADGGAVSALFDADGGETLADLLVDRDWSTAPQVGRLVYARHGRRHAERRTEMAGRLVDLGEGPEDLEVAIGQLWIDAEPSVAECVALLERLDAASADHAAVRDIVARALARAELDDPDALHLARTVASRYPAGRSAPDQWPYESPFDSDPDPPPADLTRPADLEPPADLESQADPERLAAGARVLLGAAAVADGCAEDTPPERIAEYADRLAWWHRYAEPTIATRALRYAARLLTTQPVTARLTVLRHAAAPTRELLAADWLAHTPDEPQARTDLAELAVRLRGTEIEVPSLTEYLVALARRPLAFRKVHRALAGRGAGLPDELRALV